MPLFFETDINEHTKLAVWLIRESEAFFKQAVPQHRQVTHPHKRLQHLAGRFLLKYLYPDFPLHVICIADTRRPFLSNEAYHFSISHCGDYAAAVVGTAGRVGIDIEIPAEKILRIKHKFISAAEMAVLETETAGHLTKIWSAKEAVFKWYTRGAVDFRDDIAITRYEPEAGIFHINFKKGLAALKVKVLVFDDLVLSYVM